MKALFWNSTGHRDLAKYKFLNDTSSDYQIDFIAVLETRRDDFSTTDLDHFSLRKKRFLATVQIFCRGSGDGAAPTVTC